MHTPLIVISLAFIAGLVFGAGLLSFPFSLSVLALAVLGALVVGRQRNGASLRLLFLVFLSFAAGAGLFVRDAVVLPPDDVARIELPGRGRHDITGTIVSPLDRDPGRTGFTLAVTDVDHRPTSGRIRVSVRADLQDPGYGDNVRLQGTLFEPRSYRNPGGFDYAAYLEQSGVRRIAGVKDAEAITVVRRGTGLFRTVQDWRERIRQAQARATTGEGSAILQAMVVGEEGAMTDDLRDRFQQAGVTHLISISGSHLGMVALLAFGLVRGLLFLLPERRYHQLTLHADTRKIAAFVTLPLVVFYTLLAGGQLATVRSLVLIGAGLAALVLDRDHALPHALALAALAILLVHPQAIFDISFQLSFLSVLAIGWTVDLSTDFVPRSAGIASRIGRSIGMLAVVTAAASAATAPLVAYYFNQLSLAGLAANLVVVPYAGLVVVPLGLASAVLSLPLGSLPLAGLNQAAADGCVGLVTFFSRLPAASLPIPAPSLAWLASYAGLLGSLALVLRPGLLARFRPFESVRRLDRTAVAVLALSTAALVLLTGLRFLPRTQTIVTFLDVGQGDCALIELATGENILIDGGGTRDGNFDIGRRVLAPVLWNRGVRRLDLVVLSHPHPDHMGGLRFVVSNFAVGEVWDSGQDQDLPGYAELRQLIEARGIRHRSVTAESGPIRIGNAVATILHPGRELLRAGRKAYQNENDRSLVVRLSLPEANLLFPGDIGIAAEKRLLASGRDLGSGLLKVPHHGSRSSSSGDFVAAVRPRIAVIGVGRDNTYRHPAPDVVERYERQGTRVLRTDRDGAVTVTASAAGLRASAWSGLLLERIDGSEQAWSGVERRNWSRLLVRAAAF